MIRKGSPGGGGMPPWDGKLTNQEIDDVIVWIKSLWPDDVYEVWYKEIEHKPQPNKNKHSGCGIAFIGRTADSG